MQLWDIQKEGEQQDVPKDDSSRIFGKKGSISLSSLYIYIAGHR
jgi:hypothetical protein